MPTGGRSDHDTTGRAGRVEVQHREVGEEVVRSEHVALLDEVCGERGIDG